MSTALASARPSLVQDVADLGKPRITALVLLTTATGVACAPGSLGVPAALAVIVGTGLLVAAANTLNNWLERESDARMERTRNRPLPDGRLAPWVALVTGISAAALALPLLAWAANTPTAILGFAAFASYVAIYTPLKRVTPAALLVGAVPGAMPPLMGWVAVTGRIDPGGVVLFAILFLWQIPHFLALTLLYKDDYGRGGHRVLPLVRGDAVTRRQIVTSTVALVAASLAAIPAGLGGGLYGLVAVLLGAGFLQRAVAGLGEWEGSEQARRTFLYSLLYLPAVLGTLVLL